MSAAKILVATESISAQHDGREVFIAVGTRIHATHALAKRFPGSFAPAEPVADLEEPPKPKRKRAAA